MIKLSELKNKQINELSQLSIDLKKKIFDLNLQKSLGQKISLNDLRYAKKNIAQSKTLISQKLSQNDEVK